MSYGYTVPAGAATNLTVVCGDVSFAVYPVIVGHFAGDAISGVEKRLDQSLQNQLTKRYNLGVYPAGVGSAFVARSPDTQRPAGVVVGLGDVASLTTGLIRTALISGLSELALAGPTDHDGSVAIVPLGVGKTAITLRSALGGILNAAADAQDHLKAQGFTPFSKIKIIHANEDEAHLTWHTLKSLLASGAMSGEFALEGTVVYADGWARRLAAARDRDSWRAVQIASEVLPGGNGHGLRFTSMGDMARAEGYVTADTRSAMAPLLKAAIANAAPMAAGVSPGRALFELTWPDALKRDSQVDIPTRLILDDRAAQLPFELMDDRRLGTPEEVMPPAVRHGLLRQLVQDSFASRAAASLGRPSALVIGNPRAGWLTPPPDSKPLPGAWPSLPGAQTEAEEVAKILAGHFGEENVVTLIGETATPDAVIEHVLRGGWTVLHIASHGCYNYVFGADIDAAPPGADISTLPHRTGVVLGDRIMLDNATLQSMPDPPALAFINCCDLGEIVATDEQRARLAHAPEFAASFAAQLMALGCQAVIAAGWELTDFPALAFAKTFYQQMLIEGQGLGEAVRAAREAAYCSAPQVTTWGAYQCYGEPDWRLPTAKVADDDGLEDIDYASPIEAMADLQSLTNQAGVGAGRDARNLGPRLDAIVQAVTDAGWLGEPGVAEALGFAAQSLGRNAEAISWFEACLTANAGPSVRMIEQLQFLKTRAAAADFASGAIDAATAQSTFGEAIAALGALNLVAGPTSERLSLMGGSAKRQAQILMAMGADAPAGSVIAALTQMRGAYEAACAWPADNLYYPAFMALNAAVLLRLLGGDCDADEEASDRSRFEMAIAAARAAGSDYYVEATDASAQVLNALESWDLGQATADTIVSAFNQAWSRYGDGKQLGTSIDELKFLGLMCDPAVPGSAAWLDAIAARLDGAAVSTPPPPPTPPAS
jgi:hypothetical protein